MSQHAAQRRVPVQQQVAAKQETITFPAPTRGLILNENESYMQPGAALIMDNWAPTMKGAKVRGGCTLWAQLPETTPIISAFSYASGTINRKMFYANAAEGDMNALLINLAMLRDAAPGATLHYRFVDDGRARDQEYRVAAARESQVVDDLAYAALRVDRVRGGGNATTFWVVESVPTPVRIVQHDDDGDLELQLVAYQ